MRFKATNLVPLDRIALRVSGHRPAEGKDPNQPENCRSDTECMSWLGHGSVIHFEPTSVQISHKKPPIKHNRKQIDNAMTTHAILLSTVFILK